MRTSDYWQFPVCMRYHELEAYTVNIFLKHHFFHHRLFRSYSRPRLFAVFLCLQVIAGICMSLYDDDFIDNNNIPIFTLQVILFAVLVSAVAAVSETGRVRDCDAQSALFISRSPPSHCHF